MIKINLNTEHRIAGTDMITVTKILPCPKAANHNHTVKLDLPTASL